MEYLLKVSALIAIFYVCYKLFLQRDTFFEANRWFLMLGLLTSFVLPFIVIPIYIEYTPITVPGILINEITPSAPAEKPFNPLDYLPLIYGLGVAFFTIRFLVQLSSLTKLILQNKGRKEGDFTFIETNGETPPFSFFNWIVYNPNQFNQQELAQIIAHEKTHAKQYHSIDILITQIGCVLLWFNPLMWLYNKDLKQNLEFIADNAAIKENHCKKSYQYTLLKTSMPSHQMALGNAFYNSLIKKRIVMLHKSKSRKRNQLKYALVIPALVIFLISCNSKEIETESLEKPLNNEKVISYENASDSVAISNVATRLDSSAVKRGYPLFIVNGKEMPQKEFSKITANDIESLEIFNDDNTIKKYGYKAKNGVVEVTTKAEWETKFIIGKPFDDNDAKVIGYGSTKPNDTKFTIKAVSTLNGETPLIVVDGKKIKTKNLEIYNDDIESTNVLKGETATKKYGEEGKNGVIEITTKK